jgi:hypothetical protein
MLRNDREAVGGWLPLTRERRSVRTHPLNIQISPSDVAAKRIVARRTYRNTGFVPNGLAVTTESGVEYRFVVGRRDRFSTAVHQMTA